LDGIDFLLLKIGFAALSAYPGRDLVDRDMTSSAIRMEWCMAPLHFALTMDAFHFLILTLKFSDHSPESGMYAVMIAR
jgi:hypothetical protein